MREADHVARREDPRAVGSVLGVHRDDSAVVRNDVDGLEAEVRGVPLATETPQHDVGFEAIAAVEFHDRVVIRAGDRDRLASQSKIDSRLDHRRFEAFADFLVEEPHQAAAWFDQRGGDAEFREDACVFASDHAAADDRDRPGHPLQGEQAVGIDDVRMIEVDPVRPGRSGAGAG